MCSLASGSRRDDSSSSSSWCWRDEATTWTSPPHLLSLTESDSGKGCAEAPSSGHGGHPQVFGAMPWSPRGHHATPPPRCVLFILGCLVWATAEAKLAWWEPLGALYRSAIRVGCCLVLSLGLPTL